MRDLAGNVWEWTASVYSKDYSDAHQSIVNANSSGGPRVLRGGWWGDRPNELRSAARLRICRRTGSPTGVFAWLEL